MLHELLLRARDHAPERLAVCGPDRSLRYAELDCLAEALAERLREQGVQQGDRVGVWAPKSAAVVAAMQAVLRCGAAYVPLDPRAPSSRVAHIVRDCDCRALLSTPERHSELPDAPPLVSPAPQAIEEGLRAELRGGQEAVADRPDALAYILYTSGSTGQPKGVCLSHDNALAFVHWAVQELRLGPDDRLSNHAPFHFDLSVLDLYGALAAGASVHILDESASYAPARLVEFVHAHRISVWYSVPSALMLMVDEGGLFERPLPELRSVVFAGEVYPTAALRKLQRGLASEVSLHNFYGPTETNVCAAHRVAQLEEGDARPIPIGVAASGDTLEIRRPDGRPAEDGEPGELWVSGPTVMRGYWGKPPQQGAYATGDIVCRQDDGALRFLGRRDHQVKVRGHRIELLEIEAVLAADPRFKEVCVVVEGTGIHARLAAYAVAEGKPPSLLAVKRLCAERLPKYMIVDRVHYLPSLPRTGNGKVDRRALRPARPGEEHAR